MSIFSKIRAGKQEAKKREAIKNGKEPEKQTEKVPYKHVPKHAASDALSGAPAAWRDHDRPAILAQHRRRSQMASENLSRSTSMFSEDSTLAKLVEAGPVRGGNESQAASMRSIKSNPYGCPSPGNKNPYRNTWTNMQTMDIQTKERAPNRSHSYQAAIGTYKGRSYGTTTRMLQGHSYSDSGIANIYTPSPLGTAMNSEDASPEVSPIASSGHSISSNDNLEMAGPSRRRGNAAVARQSQPFTESDLTQKLAAKRNSPPMTRRTTWTATATKQQPIAEPKVEAEPTAEAVVRPGPMPLTKIVSTEQSQKKSRLSFLGKKKAKASA